MVLSRALLMALPLIAYVLPSASVAASAGREMFETNVLGLVPPRGRCPKLCLEWFDGCNTCSCARGHLNVCTDNFCRVRRRPRCLRQGF